MSTARMVALVLGVVYVLVGLIGFLGSPLVSPSTQDAATGAVLGIFLVNPLHNVVHLAIGAALIYGATATGPAVMVARAVGIVYLAVGLLGIFAPSTFGLMPIGGTDIFLHLGTAFVLLLIGFGRVGEPAAMATR